MTQQFKRLFDAFSSRGKNLYHVGGSVRDMVLGRQPKDFDFTTDALPEITKEIVEAAEYKTFPLGLKFGTIAAHIGEQQIEITTHRRDMTQGRHPEVVFTTNLKEDLERRDFTINSMAINRDGNIIDPFDGQKHIGARIIKTTGNAMERFGEDHLRMLRAVRFASQLGFNIDRNTKRAIHTSAQAILNISRERWLEEMNKLLVGAYAGRGLELLLQTRLLGYLLPEVFPITMPDGGNLPSKDLWKHTKIVVGKAKPTPVIRWAALLHDIAKPQTRQEILHHNPKYRKPKRAVDLKENARRMGGEVHFFQHEALGAELVESVVRRFSMSNEMRKAVKGLVFLHQRVGDIVSRRNDPPVSVNALRRVVRECEAAGCATEDLVELFAADCSSSKKEVQERQAAHADLLREALKNMREEGLRPRLPSGVGLAIMEEFGLKPGPEVGKLRDMLDEMLIEGKLSPDQSAAEMAVELRKEL